MFCARQTRIRYRKADQQPITLHIEPKARFDKSYNNNPPFDAIDFRHFLQ